MMDLMFQPFRKYADFNGRAGRSEFWLFFLFNFLFGLTAVIIGVPEGAIALIWLALLVPNIALGVRRLHDIGLSGWLYLVALIPFAGALFMLVCALIPGQPDTNEYGEPVT